MPRPADPFGTMMPLIDAHQHFWSLATPGTTWPTADEALIYRDFGPEDLTTATDGLPLEGTVLVQSQPTDQDTDWMLALAVRTSLVRAVVGWVDLADRGAPDRIMQIARQPKVRGVRPMLQSITDTDWLLQDSLSPALEAVQAAGLRLDALVQPRHLPMLARFAARWPDLPIVIDHAAKPSVADAILDPWREDIARLGGLGLHCKLSGLRTEQTQGQPVADLIPYIEHLVRAFGERLMWGSDWPVLLLSGDGWRRWHDDALHLAGLAGARIDRLFAGAAAEFYALETADAQ